MLIGGATIKDLTCEKGMPVTRRAAREEGLTFFVAVSLAEEGELVVEDIVVALYEVNNGNMKKMIKYYC